MQSPSVFEVPSSAQGRLFITTIGLLLLTTYVLTWLFRKPLFPTHSPPLTKDSLPIVGALAFFTARWDFYQRSHRLSPCGHFSFYAGQHPIVGLSGETQALRRFFLDSKILSPAEAYSVLLAGIPTVKRNILVDRGGKESVDLTDKDAILRSRITAIMKPENLAAAAEGMLRDVKMALGKLVQSPKGVTDPFESLYRIVFQLTVRMMGCNEIGDDATLREETLGWFEDVANATSSVMIMFPWLPVWGKARRMYAGARLYGIFDKIMRKRVEDERREKDTLQVLMDMRSSTLDVVEFVLGALFAGQNNSGLQVAWILVHLACNAEWKQRVRDEVNAVANRYAPDTSLPLSDRLSLIPYNAWIDEFNMIYFCLKETIRLGMPGAMFRKNVSGANIPIPDSDGQVIPADTYVAMHVGDVHLNSAIWSEPHKWDPSRFLPERAEDKRQNYSWLGWGHGRHPCLGVRFAKLEINMIVALWFATFEEFELTDERGHAFDEAPSFSFNEHGTHRPMQKVLLRYRVG